MYNSSILAAMYRDDHKMNSVNEFLNDDLEDMQKLNKNLFEDIKKEDKGYYTWKKVVEGSRKPIKIEAYGSGDTGSKIRNPITGERYNYFVGSKYEDLFFKVKMNNEKFGSRDGPTLFYESPEQYENHVKCELDRRIKEKWVEKNSKATILLNKELEKIKDKARNYTIVH